MQTPTPGPPFVTGLQAPDEQLGVPASVLQKLRHAPPPSAWPMQTEPFTQLLPEVHAPGGVVLPAVAQTGPAWVR